MGEAGEAVEVDDVTGPPAVGGDGPREPRLQGGRVEPVGGQVVEDADGGEQAGAHQLLLAGAHARDDEQPGTVTPAILEHLTSLGVTAVELMPVHHHARDRHLEDRGLTNYWGYNSYGYFAPERRFAASSTPAAST